MRATSISEKLYGGWYRPSKRHRWVQLVSSDDYGDAWSLLLDAIEALRGGESTVRVTDPNLDRRRP